MARVSRKHLPRKKVAAAGAGGAVVTALIAIAGAVGIELTPEVAAAVVTLVSFAAGYFKSA